MKITKKWLGLSLIILFVFGPAMFIQPAIRYKDIVDYYEWGSIRYSNTSLGAYSGKDIQHQVTVLAYPHTIDGNSCKTSGDVFYIKNKNINLNWKKTAFKRNTKPSSINPKLNPTKLFISNAHSQHPITLTLDVKFTLSDGCLKSGEYHYIRTLKPKRQFFWLGYIIFEAFMSV